MAATVVGVLATATAFVTVPWDEPTTVAAGRVEHSLMALKVMLMVAFAAVAFGLANRAVLAYGHGK
jgi:hypothetical protein